MKYLLDSNVVSDIYNASSVNHHQVINKLLSLGEDDDIFISVLTLYEFEYAFANSPNNKKLTIKKTIAQIKEDFTILPLSVHGSEAFGELKKRFKELQSINNENIKKHTVDLIIAATALENKTILVSADKIYSSINSIHKKFIFEDWTK